MSDHSKATARPWHIGERYTPASTILDGGGFNIVTAECAYAILEGYEELLGITHWADSPKAKRELSDGEAEANANLTVAAVNSHDAALELARAVIKYVEDEPTMRQEMRELTQKARAFLKLAAEEP